MRSFKMIKIKTIEELEAERNRQLEAWIENGKEESDFFLDLAGADLREAYLKFIDLSEANFEGSDLRGADLKWADLYNANLYNTDLRGADFKSFQLGASKIEDTIITQSQYNELARLYSSNFMSFFIVKGLYEDL